MDIPAQADDDRWENVPARSSALLEEAQCLNERGGGVKALEHLIMFFPQMSSKVKMKWKPHGEITKVFWSCCSHNNLNSSPFSPDDGPVFFQLFKSYHLCVITNDT